MQHDLLGHVNRKTREGTVLLVIYCQLDLIVNGPLGKYTWIVKLFSAVGVRMSTMVFGFFSSGDSD